MNNVATLPPVQTATTESPGHGPGNNPHGNGNEQMTAPSVNNVATLPPIQTATTESPGHGPGNIILMEMEMNR